VVPIELATFQYDTGLARILAIANLDMRSDRDCFDQTLRLHGYESSFEPWLVNSPTHDDARVRLDTLH
jgi:hypothetical protein